MNRLAPALRLAVLGALALALSGSGPRGCGFGPREDRCEGLNERDCLASPGCAPDYEPTAVGCVCAPCPPGESCPPCPCVERDGLYLGCHEEPAPPAPRACVGLDEPRCLARPDCVPIYDAGEPVWPCSEATRPGCGQPVTPVFAGCEPASCPAVACELYCENGFQLDAATGCPVCACKPGGCTRDADCAQDEICSRPEPVCPPDASCPQPRGVCEKRPVPARSCHADSDCLPGQYCELWASCMALDCPLPPMDGFCRDMDCSADGACPPGSSCVADPACDGDRCPPAKRASCRADCEHLDEDGCAARPDCRGVYGSACDAAGNCTPDRAFRCERVESCQPVACRIHCENGYRRDPATGCELCECNPPEPSGCRADADCADGEVCLLTTTSCTPGTRCPAVTAGVCAPKGSCLSDADCADGEGCVFLMWDCAPGSDCWQGSWGTCDGSAPACRTDADCGRGEYCDAVRGCQPEPVSCTRDSECRVGQVCRIFCGTPPVSGVCIDAICAEDADCTMGEVCRPDPRDPCNRGELACFAPGVSVCLPQCGWLDEKGCVARADCRATYGLSAAGTWDFLACE